MTFHSKQQPGAIHVVHHFEYDDEAARLAASGFVDDDIGRVARQLDNNSFWILIATTPAWVQFSATANMFTGLQDTFSSYTGKALETLRVNATEDGIESSEADAGLGYTLQWGGNLQNTGRYAMVSGMTNGGENGSLNPGTEYVAPADGTLNVVTYNMGTGDATTVLKVWKNGAVVHTINCTGATDVETSIGVAVSVGDLIAIEYDAGMKPAGSIYVAYIE